MNHELESPYLQVGEYVNGSLDALGIKAANANPGTRTSVVDFRGNHKNVLRVRV